VIVMSPKSYRPVEGIEQKSRPGIGRGGQAHLGAFRHVGIEDTDVGSSN
jgi:hypothetical protein